MLNRIIIFLKRYFDIRQDRECAARYQTHKNRMRREESPDHERSRAHFLQCDQASQAEEGRSD